MIEPIGNKIFIKRDAAKTETKGGIIIPDKSQKRSAQGKIIAIGNPGELEINLLVGDQVVFHAYAGVEIDDDNETILVIEEEDIVAKIE